MFSIFRAEVRPVGFQVNKGSVRLVREEEDYCVKYPRAMEGNIRITQAGKNIQIQLVRDFPQEEPIIINTNGLSTCNLDLESGIVRSECVCPIMQIKVHSGTLSAKVSRDMVAGVNAHVNTGVLTNYSNLHVNTSAHETGMFGSGFWGMVGGIGLGLNQHMELLGEGTSITTFEVNSGTIELY